MKTFNFPFENTEVTNEPLFGVFVTHKHYNQITLYVYLKNYSLVGITIIIIEKKCFKNYNVV